MLFYLVLILHDFLLSYYERKENDAFQIFEDNPVNSVNQYITSFNTRNVNNIQRGDVTIRVLTEIARKHSHYFDPNSCQLIADFIQTQKNQECIFTALEFASFIMEENKCSLMDFLDVFSTELSILSSYPSNVHEQGMIFLSLLIQNQEDPKELASIFLNIPVGLIIRDGIHDPSISQSAIELAITCANCMFPALDTAFKQENIWAFQLILPYWNNSMELFLTYITQKYYQTLPLGSKKALIDLLDQLISKSIEAQHFIQTSFDFEEIGNLLDSENSEAILSTLHLIQNCISRALTKSEEAFSKLIGKCNDALIPDSIDLLLNHENQDIKNLSQAVLDLVSNPPQD